MYLDAEIQQAREWVRNSAEDLYKELPALCGRHETDRFFTISLEQAARRLEEKYGPDTAVSQTFVWNLLQMLHDLGRIKLDSVLSPVQTGKSIRSVVLFARFAFLRPPFAPPPKEDLFKPIGCNLPLDAAPVKAGELKMLRKVLHILRTDVKAARKLGKAVSEIDKELTRD